MELFAENLDDAVINEYGFILTNSDTNFKAVLSNEGVDDFGVFNVRIDQPGTKHSMAIDGAMLKDFHSIYDRPNHKVDFHITIEPPVDDLVEAGGGLMVGADANVVFETAIDQMIVTHCAGLDSVVAKHLRADVPSCMTSSGLIKPVVNSQNSGSKVPRSDIGVKRVATGA